MSIAVSFHLNKHKRYKTAKRLVIMGRVSYTLTNATGEVKRQFKFSTGQTCLVKQFSRGRVNSSATDATLINSKLISFKDAAETLYKQFDKSKKFPTTDGFKNKLSTGVTQVEEDRNFTNDFESFITYHENKPSSKRIIQGLKGTLKTIKAMSAKYNYPLDYSTMNLTFYGKFLSYCNTIEVAGGELAGGTVGLKKNTVGTHIKRLKMFLNHAKTNGWNKYEYFRSKEFKILSEKIKVVSLTEDEVSALAKLNLSKRPFVELARDYFVLGCETGLRYVDYAKITKQSIREVKNGYNLEVKTQKTGAFVVIPLSQLSMDILARYNYELPPPTSNQKMNKNLKTITGLANITKDITTHAARRTFATNQYNARTPVQWIMKITGHKTETEFYRYIGVDLSENAELVRDMHEKYNLKSGLIDSKLKKVV